MNTGTLRLLWQTISKLSPDSVAAMSHEELTDNLLCRLSQGQPLSAEERLDIRAYLFQKQILIRELVEV